MGKHRSFAADFFMAQQELERMSDILAKKAEELLGLVFQRVGCCPSEESVGIDGCAKGYLPSKEATQEFFRLGFKRIYVNRVDGTRHYYYTGGRPEGYEQ
jgi:hypothetical protein